MLTDGGWDGKDDGYAKNPKRAYALGRTLQLLGQPGSRAQQWGAEVMGKTRESLEVDQLIAAETDAEKEAQRLQPIIASPPATDLRDPTRLRKDQWKSAFGKLHPIFAQAGVVQMKKVEFVEICGDPVKTQSVGDTAFWYYQCKDGTIQFELDKGNLLAGMVAGKVNDF